MKILVLTPLNPLIQAGGLQSRVFNTWKRLSKHHQITLFCFDENIKQKQTKHSHGINFHIYPLISSSSRFIKSLVGGQVPPFYTFNSGDTFREAEKLFDSDNFDIIVADHLWLAPTAINLKTQIPKIYLAHGIEYFVYRRLAQTASSLQSFFIKLLSRNTLKKELSLINSFNFSTHLSQDEIDFLVENGLPEEKMDIIPNGIDLHHKMPADTDNPEVKLLFLGSMHYYPNDDAMKYFIADIFPIIRKKYPEIKLDIVGAKPLPWLKEISNRDNNIIVHGFLENIDPFFTKNTVCLAPLRIGAGTRVKILEYWAYGMPVISTSIGAEGLDYQDNKNILIADRTDDFAAKTLELVKNHDLRKKLAREGRKKAEEKYNWDNIAKNLSGILSRFEKKV